MHLTLKMFYWLIRETFRLLIFSFLSLPMRQSNFHICLRLVLALGIVIFNNRNHSLGDETNHFTITFNTEVFANPVFFENPAFVTSIPFVGCYVLVQFKYNSVSLLSVVRMIHLFTVYIWPLPKQKHNDILLGAAPMFPTPWNVLDLHAINWSILN